MKLKFISFFLISLLLYGCSISHRLTYIPDDACMENTELRQQKIGSNSRIYFHVKPFLDSRSNKKRLATAYAYGFIPLFTFVTNDNFANWCSQVFKNELVKSGYSLASDESNKFVIVAKIIKAHSSARFITYKGKVHLEISLLKNGKEVFKKRYSSRRTGNTLLPITRSFERSIERIVRSFHKDFEAHKLVDSREEHI